MNRLAARVARLERHGDPLAAWAGVPVEQCSDEMLMAVLAQEYGWPPGRVPTDAELREIIRQAGGDL